VRLEVEGRRQHALQWPAGIGAKGNEGVANNVAQTKGSIGYVEYAYAKQNKLTLPKMVNKDGKSVLRPRRRSRPRLPTPIGSRSRATA
jgi:ABC-type phosphate transport system substrate-binding protein